MNLIERVKNILITPKTEWLKIDAEPQSMQTVITTYVLPLVLIGSVATFIGWGFVGAGWGTSTEIAWRMALIQFVSSFVGVIITAFVVDALAPSFGSEKNINKSTQLVAYGFTPGYVGAILNVVPSIGIIGSLLGLYGIYLMYLGLTPLKKTPEDKKVIYLVITIVVLVLVYFLIGLLLGNILGTRLITGAGGY